MTERSRVRHLAPARPLPDGFPVAKWRSETRNNSFPRLSYPLFSGHVLHPSENYDWEAKVANSSEHRCNSPALNGPGYSIDHFSTAYTRPRSVRPPVVRGRPYSTICSILLSSNSPCLSSSSVFALCVWTSAHPLLSSAWPVLVLPVVCECSCVCSSVRLLLLYVCML